MSISSASFSTITTLVRRLLKLNSSVAASNDLPDTFDTELRISRLVSVQVDVERRISAWFTRNATEAVLIGNDLVCVRVQDHETANLPIVVRSIK